jgi:alkanesulfonate monooxygenase SsuD/methylene tetrahydromethanopterin reductase-like flavin-dependent oxidoreductase (luciferase family)
MYRIPYERFEKYSPYGTPEEVADFLAPYVDAGCREFNLMAVAENTETSIDAVAEIRRRLVDGG